MLRWLLGSREPQGHVEKSLVLNTVEEQTKNPYTELLVLKSHNDIVRFLVQIDDYRFASAGDDGIVFLWDVQTGDKLLELHGHTQQITAITVLPSSEISQDRNHLILTASSDKTVIAWNCDSGAQVHKISDFYATVKCLLVLQWPDLWLSGGSELKVWNRRLELLCETNHFPDTGISALVELPKNCVAAAVGTDLVIFKLIAPTEDEKNWDVHKIRCLSDHRDNIRSLINVDEVTFVSGSHAGEIIVWDSLDWTKQACESSFWDSWPQDANQDTRQWNPHKDISIQHLASDGELVYAAVGRGIYVYNIQLKRVIAYRRKAHDSNLLHIAKLPNSQLISCSEDGSVRLWEFQEKPQLTAESVPAGFFSMWGFGKSSKQAGQATKKTQEIVLLGSLELIGDLIGHSSAVQMFLHFNEHGLVTCSADHLIILWKMGERESALRSSLLFEKLEQNGGLQPQF
ncbi:WD repeat-containing protein 41 [Ambystoma mexicanum]|uniref:WD repeat-containing protein 41 n=1 Tax=Ambystoma mexicanum TaxID=8296 RepID=UPI0037E75D66